MKRAIPPRDLDKRLRIERPKASGDFDGAGSGTWELVATVWADVRDVLPSRSERAGGAVNTSARPARVRLRPRDGITPDMRFVLGDRVMQIVAGPAVVEQPRAIEFMVEDYRPAGNPA